MKRLLMALAFVPLLSGGAVICSAQTSTVQPSGERWCCCGGCCGWSTNCSVIPGCNTC